MSHDNDAPIDNADRVFQKPVMCPPAKNTIIRTSDGADLLVSRACLEVFGFDFGACVSIEGTLVTPSVITVAETRTTWENVIRTCLMQEERPYYSFDDISALLEVGVRYGLAGMPSRMRYALLQPEFLEKEAVRVYLLASAHGLQDVARIAAQATLRLPTLDHAYYEGLAAVKEGHYHRLLEYREACGQAASAVVQPRSASNPKALPTWISSTPSIWKLLTVSCLEKGCVENAWTVPVVDSAVGKVAKIYVRVRSAWVEYLEELSQVLEKKPSANLASSSELLAPVIASAADCPRCARAIYPSCTEFCTILEGQIKKALFEVRIAS
ncbi:hypothetical protein C8Q77DRAFT_1156846 [Trametes polyzona]|nr:hypothetical protein C8Q77DRAFT_1156846 [Trametes polyzona]